MLATRQRRLLRRRLISLPIGLMVGLVLDGSWTSKARVLVAVLRLGLPGRRAARAAPWARGADLVLEVVGLAALAWCWRAFGWSDPDNRRLFVRTGHLNRDAACG